MQEEEEGEEPLLLLKSLCDVSAVNLLNKRVMLKSEAPVCLLVAPPGFQLPHFNNC